MVRPKRPFWRQLRKHGLCQTLVKRRRTAGNLGLSCGVNPIGSAPHDPTLSSWASRGPVDKRCAPAKYAERVAMPVKSIEELQERVDKFARQRGTDDVSISSDGTRLDSKEKVLAFLEELARERAAHTPEG